MPSQAYEQAALPGSAAERALRRAAQGFVLLIALWLVVLGLFNLRHPSDWAMGDWLINYSAGFVRRGLLGEVALAFRRLGLPLLWTVLLVQWSLYGGVLAATWLLAARTRWNWWKTALFFSPATLAFVLQDPPFAFRKEILFFAVLAAVLCWNRSGRLAGTALLTMGCAVCVLAHEGLIVFFPYLFAGLYLRWSALRRAALAFLPPLLISAVLFTVASRFPGNAGVAREICSSIGGTLTTPPSGICGGAIDYLAHDAAYAHEQVARVVLSRGLWPLLSLFLLPVIPVVAGWLQIRRADRRAAQVLFACAVIASALSVSLFYYGTDWTRWIYIHLFSLMLLMLYAGQHMPVPAAEASALFAKRNAVRWGAWALLLLYCFGWELTVYRQRPLYGSFLRYVTHNLARGQQ